MFKVLKYLKKHLVPTILAPICMVIEVSMDFIITSVMGKLIDYVNSYHEGIAKSIYLSTIASLGLRMILFVFIGVTFGILSGVFANIASIRFGNDLRKDLFNKIMRLSFNQTDTLSTGSLITRVTNDVNTIQMMIAQMIRMFVRSFGMFVLGIIFTVSISVKFALVLLIVLPIEIILMLFFMKKAFPKFKAIQEKLDNVNTVVHENLTGARVVKAFSKESYENDRFVSTNNDLTSTTLSVNKLLAIVTPLFMIIMYVATIFIYLTGANSQISGYLNNTAPGISLGDTQKAVTYGLMIISSLIMIGMTFSSIARAFASSKRIREVLELEEEIKDGDLDVNMVKDKGMITFENVSFSYPSVSINTLSNISFSINTGESIAIVGATGSGKSTLASLLTRFYDVTDGSILIDNHNIKEYKLSDLREKITIVLQKAELFNGTILENILWGKPSATIEEVNECIKVAQATDVIAIKENGLESLVEEKGTNYSGGQKQRLSIARAIISKPEILIFDDSTSALDLVTEDLLYSALKEYLPNTTKIMVAQRIATAKHADKIIVLENGQMVAFDTHDNLMNNCDVYIDIYNSQLKGEFE